MTIKKRKRGGGKKKRFAIKDAAGAAFCIALPIYPNPKSLSCFLLKKDGRKKEKTSLQIKELAQCAMQRVNKYCSRKYKNTVK